MALVMFCVHAGASCAKDRYRRTEHAVSPQTSTRTGKSAVSSVLATASEAVIDGVACLIPVKDQARPDCRWCHGLVLQQLCHWSWLADCCGGRKC